MSDSDMDIDDDDVQVQLLNTTIQASNSHHDVKRPAALAQGMNLEGEKATTLSSFYTGDSTLRFPAPNSFPSGNEPVQKRAAHPCKFFAKGGCNKGNSCRFLHVTDNLNHTSQQQAVHNMSASTYILSAEGRQILGSKEGVRVSQLSENGKTSLHTKEDLSFLNRPGSQSLFLSPKEMHFMSLYGNLGSQSLKQKCGDEVTEKRSQVIDNSNSVASSSGPAWTGSVFSSVPMNEGGYTLRNCENRNNSSGSGSLPTLQGISVSSCQDTEGNNTSNEKKVLTNDWEPSEPFQPSFTIPPYILPSSDALYDPFTDIENLKDTSVEAPLSSIGKQAWKNSHQEKEGDSPGVPQAWESNNDDKNSSCSQNQYQEAVARKNFESYGGGEGVATSVVDQNDVKTPSKENSSAAAAENIVVLKRSKPVGHNSWHKSDGSSYKKTLKSDEVEGEVRSDAGAKVMRQFRTAVVDAIKEMLKPKWRDGHLSKDVHNMIVKKTAEKVVSAAVQYNQVPANAESVEKYLRSFETRIVKLVEGYVEKYGKQ